jgi:hypothetical protein
MYNTPLVRNTQCWYIIYMQESMKITTSPTARAPGAISLSVSAMAI